MIVLGVDIGGTFTDFVLFDGNELKVHKVLSTPHNPAEAVFDGIRSLEVSQKQLSIVHGSTVATNTFLERKGAKVALITTSGYEDVIEIGRQARSSLYDLFITRESPLVPEELRWGVQERVAATGEVLSGVKKGDLKKIGIELRKQGITSVAVCFLFSYKNSANEEVVAKELEKMGIHISASCRIMPEYREYERFSTTVVNAYVSPVMSKYLTSLENGLETENIRIMQSNGGSISTGAAKERAVNCILSGPAGGVVGASGIAKLAGLEKIISFDMGGTSTDVSLCNGDVRLTTQTLINEMPIKIPVVDMMTVGAGGGSLAYIDPGGALRVGPQSAGADPGPVCYGKGKEITVTDANLFLGRINAQFFLGGRMILETDMVSRYIGLLAKKLKMTSVRVAEGIIDVANANMASAIKVISVEKGFDVRDYTLVSFGGAGGLHACELAQSLSIKKVLVPKNAGVLSALGMTVADIVKDYSRSILLKVKERGYSEILDLFKPLISKGMKDVLSEGVRKSSVKVENSVDMRYVGQSHELMLPFKKSYIEDFHKLHKKTYGHANTDYGIEVVNIRVRVIGKTRKPSLRKKVKIAPVKAQTVTRKIKCYFRGKWLKTDIYDRNRVRIHSRIKGPAVIVEDTSTTFLPPEYICTVDDYENLIIEEK
ncbi:MAG: hydantoinase/oxoprolinase family protein [Candidatus Scalindua sp.]|nr:hydantoinase/oxoprolinase family protein [Candidatus Scalindua sp.]MBT6048889.1 hydantoinase/oxoprolinase family protein [Candidatus Scalindua sp.]MBT6561569.1 hydantoinase/oxoprolinase family protein [Candidatus Scalindua sp.]MBT7211888.1 hydantoinase/oxoprolinase family protein [Candidatus Scalindua sp.]MBT7593167.1 hydantoinase/oxoprolinase family protein [Candidatus Scalindua sp.]